MQIEEHDNLIQDLEKPDDFDSSNSVVSDEEIHQFGNNHDYSKLIKQNPQAVGLPRSNDREQYTDEYNLIHKQDHPMDEQSQIRLAEQALEQYSRSTGQNPNSLRNNLYPIVQASNNYQFNQNRYQNGDQNNQQQQKNFDPNYEGYSTGYSSDDQQYSPMEYQKNNGYSFEKILHHVRDDSNQQYDNQNGQDNALHNQQFRQININQNDQNTNNNYNQVKNREYTYQNQKRNDSYNQDQDRQYNNYDQNRQNNYDQGRLLSKFEQEYQDEDTKEFLKEYREKGADQWEKENEQSYQQIAQTVATLKSMTGQQQGQQSNFNNYDNQNNDQRDRQQKNQVNKKQGNSNDNESDLDEETKQYLKHYREQGYRKKLQSDEGSNHINKEEQSHQNGETQHNQEEYSKQFNHTKDESHHYSEEQHHNSEVQHHDSEEQHHDSEEQHHDSEEQHHDSEIQHHDSEEQHHDSEEQHHDSEEQHHNNQDNYNSQNPQIKVQVHKYTNNNIVRLKEEDSENNYSSKQKEQNNNQIDSNNDQKLDNDDKQFLDTFDKKGANAWRKKDNNEESMDEDTQEFLKEYKQKGAKQWEQENAQYAQALDAIQSFNVQNYNNQKNIIKPSEKQSLIDQNDKYQQNKFKDDFQQQLDLEVQAASKDNFHGNPPPHKPDSDETFNVTNDNSNYIPNDHQRNQFHHYNIDAPPMSATEGYGAKPLKPVQSVDQGSNDDVENLFKID